MADVKINLEAAHKEMTASLEAVAKSAENLLKQLQPLIPAQDKLKKSNEDVAKSADKNKQSHESLTKSYATSENALKSLGTGITRTIGTYFLLYEAAKKVWGFIGDTVKASVQNIDQFNTQAIGTAAAITNIADMSENAGKTYKDVFLQNLDATKSTFIQLEKLAARYFASSIDLQLAYNTFAQRGVVIRRSELEQLAQLTDLILLLTGGQQSTIQIQEEIRSLMNGTLRTTAQLSQLMKSFGVDVKEVGQQIRITQSLKPLEGILQGAKAATTEIQKTYQATLNGLETVLRQLGRIAGEGFFLSLTTAVQKFTDFLQRNRVQIGSAAAVIGKALGDVLLRFEKFAEAFLNGKDVNASLGPFIKLAAAIQTVGSALFRVVEVAAIMIRNLPLAVQAFVDAIDQINLSPAERELKNYEKQVKAAIETARGIATDPTLSKDTRDSASLMVGNLQNQLSIIEKQLADKNPFESMLDGAKSFFKSVIPGFKETEGLMAGVVAATEKLTTGLDKLGEFKFAEQFKANVKEMEAAVRTFQSKLTKVGETPAEPTAAARVPFTPNPQQLQEMDHLTKQLTDSTIQLARAKRQEREQEAAQNVDIELQGLRRRFALIEQGFFLSSKSVEDLRTVADETTRFLGRNLEATARGAEANFADLGSGISTVIQRTTFSLFSNLVGQLDAAKKGFEEFKKQSIEARDELIKAEATPHFAAAEAIRSEATANFKKQIADLEKSVTDAETKLGAAKGAKDIAEATLQLKEARQGLVEGTKTANEILGYQLQNSFIEEQIGLVKKEKIEYQALARQNAENKKIREETLRIEQQLLAEAGKLGQATINARAGITAAAAKAEAGQPRTELQAELGQVQEARIQVESQLAVATEGLLALSIVVEDLAAAGNPAAEGLRTYLFNKTEEIQKLKESSDAAFAAAQSNANFRVSLEALGNATKSALNGVLDSVLASFEGKKTNFANLFKGIADNLVKDSMKNVFDTLSTSLQTGFKKAFQAITDDVSGEMAKTLGPAFMAGFGLLASFVLGQIMGNQGGSATAGNATVGIQSTEQVRGLIGGETQIPIGLVGESLQDALVPTNLWLARIAGSIERLGSVGGLNPGQIEAIIERSVTDALQIQPV